MRNHLSVSRRRAAFYNMLFTYAGVAFGAITGIFLVPLYLHYFDLATYGAWVASGNIVGLLGVLEGGFNFVLVQRAATAYGSGESKRFAEISGSGGLLGFCQAGLVALTGLVIAPWVPGWINADPSQYTALSYGFALAALGSSFMLGYYTFGAIAAARQLTFFPGMVNVVSLIAGVLATIVGLWQGWGVTALGLGAFVRGCISMLLVGGYSVIAWRAESLPKPKINFVMFWELMRTTLPLMAGRTGNIVFGNSQAAIISIVLNPTAAAILSLTGRVYDLSKMILAPFGSSVFAGLAQVKGIGDSDKLRFLSHEIIGLFSAVAAISMGVALALNQAFVVNWIGFDKFGGIALSFALCLSAVATSRLNLLSLMVTSFGEISKVAWSGLIELLLHLPLMFILLRTFGLIGMPLADIFSILLVSGWFTNLLLVRNLHLRGFGAIQIVINGIWPLVAALSLGCIWTFLIPFSGGWGGFVVQALACLTIISVTVYIFSPSSQLAIRNTGQQLANRWQSIAWPWL